MRRPAYYGNPAGVTAELDVVRAIYDAFARRDLEAMLRHVAPDCELYLEGTAARAGRTEPYRGHDGLREYFADVERVWDELALHAEDYRAVPGSVIVMGHASGVLDGRRTRRAAVWTWRVRDGKAISIRVADMGELSAVHPRVEGALRTQLDAWRAALDGGARRVGWKVALHIAEVEELIGPEPVIGHLTTATLLEPGGTYQHGTATLRAETEVAIDVGRDLDPAVDAAAAAAAIAGYRTAIELVDVERPPGGMEAIVAANVFHRAVILGPSHPDPPTGEARTLVGGKTRQAAPVTLDAPDTVCAVARLLGTAGERLRAGDVILAGSLTHTPVAAGDHVAAEIDGIGRVTATIA